MPPTECRDWLWASRKQNAEDEFRAISNRMRNNSGMLHTEYVNWIQVWRNQK